MKVYEKIILALVLLLIGMWPVIAGSKEVKSAQKLEERPAVGYLAPNFILKNLAEEEVRLSDYAGKVVVLNFWTTWCYHCREEMPSLEKFYQDYKTKDVAVVAVNIGEKKEMIEKFIKQKGYSFEVLLDKDGQVAETYGVRGIPRSFILGKDRKVLKVIYGGFDFTGQDFKNLIDGLLKKDLP